MSDKYDREIEELLSIEDDEAFREAVQDHWAMEKPLFQTATPTGGVDRRGDDKWCGCLTQIRRGWNADGVPMHAWTPALTKAIKADKRIPTDPKRVTRESLPAFAEWQRRLDKELGR